jgi:putative tricarboxylic transport membrane protein
VSFKIKNTEGLDGPSVSDNEVINKMKSKSELRFDIKIGVFLLGVALFYVLMTIIGIKEPRFQNASLLRVTAFPRVVSLLLVGSALAVLGRAIYLYLKNEKQAKAEERDQSEDVKKNFDFPCKEFLPVLVSSIAYIALLKPLGFLLDSMLLSLVILFYVNPKKRLRNILFSLLFPTVVFLLFNYLLIIYLPVGTIFGGYSY